MSRKLAPAEAEVRRVLEPGATHYEVLRVAPAEVPEQLDAARRGAMMLVHPDRWTGEPPVRQALAHDAAARVNAAHACLADPRARRLYDAGLRATHVACAGCRGMGLRTVRRGFTQANLQRCADCGGAGYIPKEPKQ